MSGHRVTLRQGPNVWEEGPAELVIREKMLETWCLLVGHEIVCAMRKHEGLEFPRDRLRFGV